MSIVKQGKGSAVAGKNKSSSKNCVVSPDFKTLFENSPGLYLVLLPDKKFTIVGVSNNYARATMTKSNEIIGQGLFEVFPDNPDDKNADGESNLKASLNRAIRLKKPDAMMAQKYDIRKPASEGGEWEVRYWDPLNTPVLNEKDEVEYIIHCVVDITEEMRAREREKQQMARTIMLEVSEKKNIEKLKESEEQIKRINRELIQNVNGLKLVNKELESFTYSVSHDLRAPLRAIRGYTDILKEEYLGNFDAEGIKMMEAVASSALRMSQLIDDLLEFSRMAKTEMKLTDVNMNAIINTCLHTVKASYNNELNINIAINNLPPACVDASLMENVFTNLISNAVKYSSKVDCPNVEISSYVEGDENIYVIKDNGVGFDMKYYDKLFGVFQRLHSKTEFEGTGVGLALVKRIVTRHGGRVWAEAEPNKGAAFYVALSKMSKS